MPTRKGPENETQMNSGDRPANAQGPGGGKGASGPKNQGGKGEGGSGGGGLPKLPQIPDVPDGNGGAGPIPEPVDLSLLAGPEKAPERKPLQSPALGVALVGQSGVTGYAGVFIP